MAMFNYEDLKIMLRAESEIRGGRRVTPGDFYLEKSTLTSIDPNTGAKTYSTALELCLPTVRVLKGDEVEIVAGMNISAGDLIATFSYAKNLPHDAPSTTDSWYYDRVKYLADYYRILNVWPKGSGTRPNRKVLVAKKEP